MDDARPRCTSASVSVIHRWRCGRWRRGHSNRKLPPTPISVRNIPTDQVRQYPFEFAKTRVQLRNQSGAVSPKNPFLVVGQVFRNEGVRALYKGCSTLVVVRVISEPCLISRNASCSMSDWSRQTPFSRLESFTADFCFPPIYSDHFFSPEIRVPWQKMVFAS